MSSAITVNRICEYCGAAFNARTTVTRYCSHSCNQKDYKKKLRERKIEFSHYRTAHIKRKKTEETDGDVLTVSQAVRYLGNTSRQTVEKLIASGRLKATRITKRNTRILKADLLDLFDNNIAVMDEEDNPFQARGEKAVPQKARVDKLYTIDDLKIKFGKNRDALYCYLKRNNIAGIKSGKNVLYREEDIDRLYKKFAAPMSSKHDRDRKYNERLSKKLLRVDDCYTMEECELKFNKKKSLLYGIFSRRFVPTLRDGRSKYYCKAAVDRIYKSGNVVQKDKGGGEDERC